ncbi:hypothetical protein R83H12_01252 [Fibrobacteria bacterium R8-3-H12]
MPLFLLLFLALAANAANIAVLEITISDALEEDAQEAELTLQETKFLTDEKASWHNPAKRHFRPYAGTNHIPCLTAKQRFSRNGFMQNAKKRLHNKWLNK